MSRKTSFVCGIAVLTGLGFAPGVRASTGPLANFDARTGERTEVPAVVDNARDRVADRLGPETAISSDPVNGGVRTLGATDATLTQPDDGGASAIALDYVSTHDNVLGLDDADIAALRLAARYTSPDGVTHLTWQQTDHGIPSYDTFLSVNVAADGSIVNVTGSPVHDLSIPSAHPDLSRAEGAAASEADIGRGADASASSLAVFADPSGDRLAWRSTVTAADGTMYDEVIDASTGELLARSLLTAYDAGDASVYDYHPGAASGGTPHTVSLTPYLNSGATTLTGPFAHAYSDNNPSNDTANAAEEVPPNGGGDWIFGQVGDGTCPANTQSIFTNICTWAGSGTKSSEPNRKQATTQLFYFVSNYHDWLTQAAVGFNNASHNFEVGGTGGSDPVLAEADDGSGTNNANMSTPADGQSPRMQMYLFTNPAVNADDDASVVYHEYTHGLSNRLINNGLGDAINDKQSRAMGEGWSDWYAMDYIVAHGWVTDTAADGEIPEAEYSTNNAGVGFRHNALDCPVGSTNVNCPGTPTPGTVVGTTRAGPGGYTFDDVGKVGSRGIVSGDDIMRFEEHDDGEIWAETLWDLRTALGAPTSRSLITAAMRLSPPNPSFIDMRDAILQADAAVGGAHNAQIWQVFATRGLGFGARTSSANATRVHASFISPPLASTGTPQVSDPPPLGDGDGVAEPGETIRLALPLQNPGGSALTNVAGTLSSGTPGVFVGQPTGSYGNVNASGSANASDPYAITIPASASCANSVALTLGISTGQGTASSPISLPLGTLSGTSYQPAPGVLPSNIPDPNGSTIFIPSGLIINIQDPGTIDRMRVYLTIGHQGGFTHTWDGDFSGRLVSPSGTSIELFERPGPFSFGSDTEGLSNVIFDDRASVAIQDLPFDDTDYLPAASGSFRPNEPLAKFAGEQQQGNWKLRIYDGLDGDAGTVTDFKIETGSPLCSTTVTPPVATTDPVSAGSDHGATLHGKVNPAGVATNYAFEYGTTTDYGQRTTPASAGSGSADTNQNAPISGLTPNTTYHYRTVALRAGTVVAAGGDRSFRTAPAFSIADASKVEGNSGSSSADLTVTLDPSWGSSLTVHYETSDGTATEPGDYTSAAGTLTFDPGQTTKTISVPVKGDTLDENDETVSVDLSTPSAGTLADAHGVLTINDDDDPPTVSLADASTAEGNSGTSDAQFPVTLGAASARTVTVNYATSDGTATQPGDYLASSGQLTFAPGETAKTVTVLVAGDPLDEPDETFNLDLSAPANVTLADGHAVGTIVDDDEPASGPPATTPPDTKIDSGPTKVKKGKSATFSFSSTAANSHFECKLDSDAFAPCTSPTEVKNPKKGKHTFAVRAIDTAGNVDPSPATQDFTVKKKKKHHHHH